MRGLPGVLLLVRVGTGRSGVVDAVYRLRGSVLERVRVGRRAPYGLVTAAGASGFVDFDCGRGARTIEQITAEPHGTVWRETVATYALQPAGFALVDVSRRTVGAAAASQRRCPVARQ
ncbi:MAG TPA: hypothetical protein VFI10_03040 [Gaiellaceae bacterium]|nr:hypothetical protein [Gaiellaceae bacterium]